MNIIAALAMITFLNSEEFLKMIQDTSVKFAIQT
jgi:hypothetical protein